MTSLGENIKLLREIHGITVKELAERAELSIGTINNIMTGKGKARMSTLCRIAQVFGITAKELIGEEFFEEEEVIDKKQKQEDSEDECSINMKIKKICASKNMTLEELSQVSGISISAIRKIGNSQVKTRKFTRKSVAKVLGISEKELM